MKALVVEKPNEYGLRDISMPTIGPTDVLVKVAQTGICGSDYEVMDGTRPEPYVKYPIVIGHETCGTIVEVGKSVHRLKEGMRVTTEAILRCDTCSRCLTAQSNLCLNYSEVGFVHDGGFAEYVALPANVVHPIPDDFSFEHASLAEPAACAMLPVIRAGIQPGENVVIIGPGPIGLIAVMGAKLYGPDKIILVGTRDNRLEVGKKCGATHTVNINKQNPLEVVNELTDGQGADVVIECSGNSAAVAQAIEMVRRGGRVGLEGIPGGGAIAKMIVDVVVFKDIPLIGSVAYTRESFSFSLKMMMEGRLNLDAIITHKYKLNDWQDAFKSIKERQDGAIKGLVSPG